MPRHSSDPLPDFIPPELALQTKRVPTGEGWIHELKIHGYRAGARIERGKVQMLTRHAIDWTAKFRPIAYALASLKARATYLDGEVAVLTVDGVSNFGALQKALGRHGGFRELAFVVFDILHLDGRDLRGLPLVERKSILEKLLGKLPPRSRVQYSAHINGPRAGVLRPRLRAAA
jgi:bifunctional non-homologous end joining protein LigD